jgi:glycosyltransferase involved in cell wall biosynthesis
MQFDAMHSPEISIVVPLYNKEHEIGPCIKSVIGQSFQDFELIVVNDGSTDAGAEVVRSYQDSRIRLIEQPNGGVASARNRGIAEAKAKLIAFLDADDQWCLEFLATISALARRCPEAGAYFTAFWIHRGSGWARKAEIPQRYLREDKPLLKDYFSTPAGLLISSAIAVWKQTFDRVGPYREMFGEDVDLWLRIAAFYPIAYSAKAQAVWNLNASNRRCVKQRQTKEMHRLDALLPSVGEITAATHVAAATKRQALDYVARRELQAVLPLYCLEGAERGRQLLRAWEASFGHSPLRLRIAMRSPRLLVRAFQAFRANAVKCRNTCAYLWYRREAKGVIFQ